MSQHEGFALPPYPYARLDRMREVAASFDGFVIDFSVGSPCDPPADAVRAALAHSDSERGYPPSFGTVPLRDAIAQWILRRFGVAVPDDQIATTVGTKEFIVSVPQWLRLRSPQRDTVLYPAISYPSYAMGAMLAGCRALPVPVTSDLRLDLDAIDDKDTARALLLWVNSPNNPTGTLDDLEKAADWGRAHDVPIFSDECYAEFTWTGRPATVLSHGLDRVVAVHSLSKRSNLAGLRVGFYAGDHELVTYLREIRQHAGLLVPGPAQAAAIAALDDDASVADQRARYQRRLARLVSVLRAWSGLDIRPPQGGIYLWFQVDDSWAFVEKLARAGGALVSPGEFYGAGETEYIRVAATQPDSQVESLAIRLGGAL
jgi:succinyldiaminopimelate transaminase